MKNRRLPATGCILNKPSTIPTKSQRLTGRKPVSQWVIDSTRLHSNCIAKDQGTGSETAPTGTISTHVQTLNDQLAERWCTPGLVYWTRYFIDIKTAFFEILIQMGTCSTAGAVVVLQPIVKELVKYTPVWRVYRIYPAPYCNNYIQ